MTHRSSFHRSVTLLTAIALPLSMAGCGVDTEALLPISAACDGVGVPEAAEYDPTVPNPPAVAIYKEESTATVDNGYLGTGPEQAASLDMAQVVVCIYPGASEVVETCRYTGTRLTKIERLQQSANVTVVSAKTGQPLGADSFSAEARNCPDTISYRQGSEPEDQVYDAEGKLRSAIADWVPGAIASAQPMDSAAIKDQLDKNIASIGSSGGSVSTAGGSNSAGGDTSAAPPSGPSGNLEAQCEALDAATDTEFGDGYGAKLSAESGTVYMNEGDSDIRVAVRLGLKGMKRNLDEIGEAIAAAKGANLQEPELVQLREEFLAGLTTMEGHLKRFQALSQAAEPHSEARPPVRDPLTSIAEEMAALSRTIEQQHEALRAKGKQIFSRCLELT
ncbi:MAG: hypothetical protein ACFCA4_07825 [Cyanophyceae cyanobacterium]